jgi:hypothetical protein
MNLSTKQITFLRDIHPSINVNKTSGWRFLKFDGLTIWGIQTWLKLIGDDKIYLLIPNFGNYHSLKNARLRLSDPFLVNNKSNPTLIFNFIDEQWKSSGFSMKETPPISLYFEFKRVYLSYK